MDLGVPERFIGDRYHVVRELGRGGMGVVYLGRDLQRDMDVAIKFRGLGHADATLWLKREFRVVASLRHPNLCELYELVAHDGSCYFTMEYLPGIDPRRYVAKHVPAEPTPLDHLQTTRTVPPLQIANTELSNGSGPEGTSAVARPAPVDHARVRSVLVQLAEGLAFLHAHGVIHRDVKPSNAIVVDGTVKLLDFGLALERARQDDDLAREARVVGTAAYLAPEYVEQLVVGPAMDVYALGILAYELITGAPPFGGAIGFLSRHRRAPIPRASAIAELPPELDDAIARMMNPDPKERPTALDIAQLLSDQRSASPRVARRAQRFVGRSAELARLASRIAEREPRGRLVLVTGPSGVGKTALIEEACRIAAAADPDPSQRIVVWRGRCHERERVPYRAFDSIIDDLATQLASDPTLITTVEHAGALGRVFPVLGALIEQLTGLAPAAPAIDLRVERERALASLAQLFRALAPRGVLAIDDLQWADADSLELLATLVERIQRPLTVLATWMTDDPPHEMRALLDRLHPVAELVALPAMPAADLATLITDLAPNLPGPRVDAAASLAAGNPYLAEMIGRELADSDLSQPPSPHHAEARRLSRLSTQERMVAELASLATGATSFPQLRELAGLPASRLSSALRGLEEARVLRAIPSATGDVVYAFYHQRLRDAAHESMPPAERRGRHARFAGWFERAAHANAEQLAYHWQHAGERTRAARWAIAAGDAAFAQLAWALAADWYAKALELDPSPSPAEHVRTAELIAIKRRRPSTGPRPLGSVQPRGPLPEPLLATVRGTRDDLRPVSPSDLEAQARRASEFDRQPLRAKLAQALMFDGRLADAAHHFLAIAREPGDDADQYRVRAAEALLKLGEIDRSLVLLDEVLARRGETRTSNRALSIGRALAVGVRWLAPVPKQPLAADPVRADAYRAIASYLSTPHPIEALEYVLRGIELSQRTGDLAAYSQGLAMLAGYLAAGSLGRFGDRALARADQISQQTPTIYPQMVIHGARGILSTLRGDWAAMRSCREAGETICRQLGLERSWEASFLRTHGALGEVYACDPRRALALLADAPTADDLFGRALSGSYRGRALVLAGELEDARHQQRELAADPASTIGVAAIYRGVFEAELALAEHAWDRARRITEEATAATRAQWLSTMPAITTMVDIPRTIANLGLARAGDRSAARVARATAKKTAARSRHSFYAATALRLQAQAELLLGDPRWRRTLEAAKTHRMTEIDRLAIAALEDRPIEAGWLAPAIAWNTGGIVG